MLHTVPITVTQIVFTNLTSTQEGAIINLTNNHKMFRIYTVRKVATEFKSCLNATQCNVLLSSRSKYFRARKQEIYSFS